MKSKQQVAAIIAALKELYPDALCSLDYQKDYELLFSVRLAAQCTDARVNLVTPALFARYPTLEAFAAADVDEVGTYIHSCGFWRAKARDIVGAAQMLVEHFGGKVPDNMDDLLSLPGVGRKTANLILGDIYGTDGYVCDTHCIRITGRLGLTDGSKDPPEGGAAAAPCHSPEEANNFCHRMVLHGRALCMARKPNCAACSLRPSATTAAPGRDDHLPVFSFVGADGSVRPPSIRCCADVGDGVLGVPTARHRALLGPLWEGLSAQPTGERKKRVASLLPPALRADTSSQREASVSINPLPCHSEPVTDVTGVGIRNL